MDTKTETKTPAERLALALSTYTFDRSEPAQVYVSMLAAFENVIGRKPLMEEPDDAADRALMNEALGLYMKAGA